MLCGQLFTHKYVLPAAFCVCGCSSHHTGPHPACIVCLRSNKQQSCLGVFFFPVDCLNCPRDNACCSRLVGETLGAAGRQPFCLLATCRNAAGSVTITLYAFALSGCAVSLQRPQIMADRHPVQQSHTYILRVCSVLCHPTSHTYHQHQSGVLSNVSVALDRRTFWVWRYFNSCCCGGWRHFA